MWPVVRDAIDFVMTMQLADGEIAWAASQSGILPEALLTGCASIHHSLRCAVALAELRRRPAARSGRSAAARLGHALAEHPESFLDKDATRWTGTTRCSAVRSAARPPGPGSTPAGTSSSSPAWASAASTDPPWVTGAETCELVLALDAIGDTAARHELFTAMQHLRDPDGSYWTGLVFSDGKRWPVERTTWTGAAVILAADALSPTTAGSGIFRGVDLPRGLVGEFDCACATSGR